MNESLLVMLAGPLEAGTSTVASLVAVEFAHSTAIEMDYFWATVVSGSVAPWS